MGSLRRVPVLLVLALALLPAASSALVADDEPEAEPQVVTAEERDAALKKAFVFLDENLWKMTDGGSPRKQYAIAVTGWAYVLAGERVGKRLPPRTREIKRIRDYVENYLEQVERVYDKSERDEKPPPTIPGMPPGMSMDRLRTAQYVWPLSMATHFLAESHARGKGKRTAKRLLKRIVKILEACQQPNGGWGHDDAQIPGFGLPAIPIPKPGGGTTTLNYPHTLLAASNCAGSGLGAGHRVLGTREPESVANAIAYFRASQNTSGAFPYDPSQTTSGRGMGIPAMTLDTARTGGAVLALLNLGVPVTDACVQKAINAIDANVEHLSEGHGSASMALQLGAVAMRARGDAAWAVFRSTFFRRILDTQDEDGAFDCICKGESPGVTCDTSGMPAGMPTMPGMADGKKAYVTAIHCLILLLDRTEAQCVPPMPEADFPVTPAD